MSRLLWLTVGTILIALPQSVAGASPDPRLASYQWPPGWKVEIAAIEPLVINPIHMSFGLDGRLYVIEWMVGRTPNDRIKVLTDNDGDGIFDKAEIVMDGLDLVAGVMFWDGWMYLTREEMVVRYKDQDGDGKFEVREVVASGFHNNNSHHRLSGMMMGPDGWLYLTAADQGTDAKGSDGSTATLPRCGGMFRCRPDGSKLEIVSIGLRNPWGNVAFDNAFHIFHTDNDSELTYPGIGSRIMHLVEGGDYGWRTRDGGRGGGPDPERGTWRGGRPGRLGLAVDTGRGAPTGVCITDSTAFPPSVRNLFVHPDVFRRKLRAYRLKPTGATYTMAEEFDLLTADEGVFRPSDAELGPDGALYVLDWRNDHSGSSAQWGNGVLGRIYRMTWSGTPQEPARPTLPRDRFVKLVQSDDAALVAALKSEDYGLRRTANLELIRRGSHGKLGKDVSSSLAKLLADQSQSAQTRCHALAILQNLGVEDGSAFTADRDPALRHWAYELVGRFADPKDAKVASRLLARVPLEDDPQCIRALGVALGRFRGLERGLRDSSIAVDQIVAELMNMGARDNDFEPFWRDGYCRGLERLGPVALANLARTIERENPASLRTKAALYALESWRNPDGLKTILAEATSETSIPPVDRANLFFALREFIADVPPEPIARWLQRASQTGPEPSVEAIRVLKAMRQRAAAAAGPVLPELLADPRPEVRAAALALAVEIRLEGSKPALLKLAQAADRSPEERSQAVLALRGFRDRSFAPVFEELFRTATDPMLQSEVLRALGALDFDAAAVHARALLGDKDPLRRASAIQLLGEKPATALEVVNLFNAGKLPAEDIARVIEAVRGHSNPELQAAVQTLLKNNKVLGMPDENELRRLRSFVYRYGNPERGKAVFFDDKKAACATCHRIEGRGGAVGPDLTRVWEALTFDSRVESILDPSQVIKEGFTAYKVATKDGRVLTGLLLAETPEAITLKDAQARELRIPQSEIDEKMPDKVSLMPSGIAAQISYAELADLLAFLGDRKAQEGLRTEGATSPPAAPGPLPQGEK